MILAPRPIRPGRGVVTSGAGISGAFFLLRPQPFGGIMKFIRPLCLMRLTRNKNKEDG